MFFEPCVYKALTTIAPTAKITIDMTGNTTTRARQRPTLTIVLIRLSEQRFPFLPRKSVTIPSKSPSAISASIPSKPATRLISLEIQLGGLVFCTWSIYLRRKRKSTGGSRIVMIPIVSVAFARFQPNSFSFGLLVFPALRVELTSAASGKLA